MSDVVSSRRQQQVLVSGSLDLEGVIDEILSWLPAKSLLRFRCVCKAWRALISDPYFIRKHLSCINPNITTSYSLLIREDTFRSAKCEAILECLSHDLPLSKRRLEFSVSDPLFEVCFTVIVGSCNGLVCLLLDFENPDVSLESITFVLWNPCTGESQVLPLPPIHFSHRVFYGFGYDSTTNDYKVILGSSESGVEFVAVFSLKMGSWKQLERLSSYFGVIFEGCLVNEALHWVLEEVEDGRARPFKMVSFDLGEEKFHEIPFPYPPNLVDSRPELVVDVGVLNKCLTLYYQTDCCLPGYNFKMWMLKEYGVKESWTEVIDIPSEILDQETKEYTYMTCISENGEILMQSIGDGSSALYNPKEKIFKKLMDSGGYWYDTCTYIETLVSPVTGSTGIGI